MARRVTSVQLNKKIVSDATYTVKRGDDILLFTYTSTDTVAITLPSSILNIDKVITVKDAGGNAGTKNITISTEGSAKIDGQDIYVILGDYDAIDICSEGDNFYII